jgi:hypothetical protein
MPFLGKKLRLQKAVRFLSISVAALLLAVGIYFQVQLMRVNRQRGALRDWLEPSYLAVMLNKKVLPNSMTNALRDVQSELRRITRGRTGGGTDQTSVPAMLTQVFRAFNACAEETDLDAKSVTISNNVIINGETSSRSNTRAVVDALEEAGLEAGPIGVSPGPDGEVVFSVTLGPKRTMQ